MSGRSSQSCDGGPLWVMLILLFLTLTCLATTVLFAVLYWRNSSGNWRLKKTPSRRQTGSLVRGSTRRQASTTTTTANHQDPEATVEKEEEGNEESESDEEGDGAECNSHSDSTKALSDTVLTPLPTPASMDTGPRLPKIVSTEEFVDLELM